MLKDTHSQEMDEQKPKSTRPPGPALNLSSLGSLPTFLEGRGCFRFSPGFPRGQCKAPREYSAYWPNQFNVRQTETSETEGERETGREKLRVDGGSVRSPSTPSSNETGETAGAGGF